MKVLFNKSIGTRILPAMLTALILAVLLIPAITRADRLQDNKDKKTEKKEPEKKEKGFDKKDAKKADARLDKYTAEQIVETVILAYGGRDELMHVRTNGSEEGIIKLASDDKDIEGRISRKFLRKDQTTQDLTRVDVELPTQKLTFGYNGYTVWAARDGVNFTPSTEAEASFLGSLVHNYDALLRYKEQGGTLERTGSDTIVGLEVEKIDLTHKDGSKTRYYISTKTFRILHLDYELKLQAEGAVTKFRESFYDFRPVQNTLLPSKSVLFENGRLIQEIRVTQAKYHDNLNEEIFLKY